MSQLFESKSREQLKKEVTNFLKTATKSTPKDIICPISKKIMSIPVILNDETNIAYDYQSLVEHRNKTTNRFNGAFEHPITKKKINKFKLKVDEFKREKIYTNNVTTIKKVIKNKHYQTIHFNAAKNQNELGKLMEEEINEREDDGTVVIIQRHVFMLQNLIMNCSYSAYETIRANGGYDTDAMEEVQDKFEMSVTDIQYKMQQEIITQQRKKINQRAQQRELRKRNKKSNNSKNNRNSNTNAIRNISKIRKIQNKVFNITKSFWKDLISFLKENAHAIALVSTGGIVFGAVAICIEIAQGAACCFGGGFLVGAVTTYIIGKYVFKLW